MVSLRCITLLLEFELPNLKKPEVIDKLQRNGFISMSNHCYRNTTDSEMTNATFKVKHFKSSKLLLVLVMFVYAI